MTYFSQSFWNEMNFNRFWWKPAPERPPLPSPSSSPAQISCNEADGITQDVESWWVGLIIKFQKWIANLFCTLAFPFTPLFLLPRHLLDDGDISYPPNHLCHQFKSSIIWPPLSDIFFLDPHDITRYFAIWCDYHTILAISYDSWSVQNFTLP